MASDKEKVLELIEDCISNEELAVKKYTELMELFKDESIKQFIAVEKQHTSMLKEIRSSIQQI